MNNVKSSNATFRMKYIISIVIASITISSGTVAWFWKENTKLLNKKYENEITSVKYELTKKIDDLTGLILSIERRSGGKKLYINVADIPISKERIPTLHENYKAYERGLFYVREPKSDNWRQIKISQVDRINMIAGERLGSKISQMPILGKIYMEKTANMWFSGNKIKIKPNNPLSIYYNKITLFPHLYVTPISKNHFLRLSKAFSEFEKVAKSSDDRESNVVAHDDILLETLMDDLAGFMLSESIIQGYKFAIHCGGNYRISTADKKGEMLYMRSITTIPCKLMTSNLDAEKIYLDEELFVYTKDDKGISIKISIPSVDLHNSSDYAYTQSWLTSLRIPE